MFFLPVRLLAFCTAVSCVPAAVVDCLCFTVVTLKQIICYSLNNVAMLRIRYKLLIIKKTTSAEHYKLKQCSGKIIYFILNRYTKQPLKTFNAVATFRRVANLLFKCFMNCKFFQSLVLNMKTIHNKNITTLTIFKVSFKLLFIMNNFQ